nr:retrovirus-related Pol polyprotein from transposon TNT 1-94 [Tanacetum cinerariifolium]
VNHTLRDYYEEVGISHETSVARSPQQNRVVERRNHTLIKAARIMLIYAQAPLFLWAEAVATACFTQNRSIICLRHGKTPYELLHSKLPDLSFFHVFGALCYSTNDSENLGLVPTTSPLTSYVPPSRNDWDLLFQPMFDELLNPLPSVVNQAPKATAPIIEVIPPVNADSTSSPSSTTVDQDDYYEEVGISHETSVARSPRQNGVVERRNRTLIEAARTMLIFAQAPLFLWAEAVATACFTQNRSIIRLRHGKTMYELMHCKQPNLSFFHVFGAFCYPTNDSENVGKLQPKADIRIFIGYAPTKKAFRIYNRRTRRIVETIHVDFNEPTAMASEHSSSGPALNDMTPGTISSGLVQNLLLQHLMYHLQGMAGICCFNRCSMNYSILLQVLIIKLLKLLLLLLK